jgi:putative phosphoesterase
MLVGVVSDTHGHLDARLLAALEGVDAILHAGDVGSEAVLAGLRRLAPLYAVCGNNDAPLGGLGLPSHVDIELAGLQVHLVHQLPDARPAQGTGAIVFGHSHRPLNEWRNGVLYLNPGAAGVRGFHALQTAALLRIAVGSVRVGQVVLGPRPARPARARAARG